MPFSVFYEDETNPEELKHKRFAGLKTGWYAERYDMELKPVGDPLIGPYATNGEAISKAREIYAEKSQVL